MSTTRQNKEKFKSLSHLRVPTLLAIVTITLTKTMIALMILMPWSRRWILPPAALMIAVTIGIARIERLGRSLRGINRLILYLQLNVYWES